LPAAVVAAVVGNLFVHLVGVDHASFPQLDGASVGQLARLAVTGVVCGIVAQIFVRMTEGVRDVLERRVRWSPLRPFLGGLAVVAATLLVGTTAYNGLSEPLVANAVRGLEVATWAFAAKLIFTALTAGSGFQGGEVTPLFVIGATLGSTMGSLLDVPLPIASGVAMVATFGAAAHAPVAVIVMGVELFGWRALPALVVTCGAARLVASRHHLYETLARDATASA
jgi:H+/Cl- antiporter ClcA